MQRDRKALEWDRPIKEYWPEFAQNGKEAITTEDVCRHQAGLWKLHKKYKMSECHTENILKNKIGEIIETDTALWPDNYRSKRIYHAMTKDLILNEIFRRVDTQKRTMGQFIRQELWDIVENQDIILGATD